jgi:hypothetical protein
MLGLEAVARLYLDATLLVAVADAEVTRTIRCGVSLSVHGSAIASEAGSARFGNQLSTQRAEEKTGSCADHVGQVR